MGYTVFATPWVALGYELTPDYHERTRLMGTQNFIGQLAYVVSPWFLWIMTYEGFFPDQVAGAAGLAIVVAVVAIGLGVLPAILLRERMQDGRRSRPRRESPGQAGSRSCRQITEFFKGFGVTLSSGPFLKLCVATFLVFNGFMLISSFQFYVIIYYVCGGDQTAGAKYAGYAGTVGASAPSSWSSSSPGSRRGSASGAPSSSRPALSIVGYALKWVCYNPDLPLLVVLPAPLLAFGLGGLFTLMPSMVADVVDTDELKTHQRREGMFGSIFWWMVKLGMAAALAGGGYLLNATGFDVALGGEQPARTIILMRLCDAGIPILASAIAIWAGRRTRSPRRGPTRCVRNWNGGEASRGRWIRWWSKANGHGRAPSCWRLRQRDLEVGSASAPVSFDSLSRACTGRPKMASKLSFWYPSGAIAPDGRRPLHIDQRATAIPLPPPPR